MLLAIFTFTDCRAVERKFIPLDRSENTYIAWGKPAKKSLSEDEKLVKNESEGSNSNSKYTRTKNSLSSYRRKVDRIAPYQTAALERKTLEHYRKFPVQKVQVKRIEEEFDDEEELKSVYKPEEDRAISTDFANLHVWPVDEAVTSRVSSPFAWRTHPITGRRAFHTGIDIAAALGSKVLASMEGRVEETGVHKHLGKFVKLSHIDGSLTVYGHLMKIDAKENQMVKQGEKIGELGSTGRSTGPHLHYTMYINGKLVDPMPRLVKYLERKNLAMKN